MASAQEKEKLPREQMTEADKKDKLVKHLFKGVLKKLKALNLKDTSPSIFLVYAHDSKDPNAKPADMEPAQTLIKWLQDELELNLYSDDSPVGQQTNSADPEIVRKKTDTLWSQLCLLPDKKDSVDYVILCGSQLLKSYADQEVYSQVKDDVSMALARVKNESKSQYANVNSIISKYRQEEYHHLLPELIFLDLRLAQSKLQSTVIPLLLNGDGKSALPNFILRTDVYNGLTRWRDHQSWKGKDFFANQNLHLGLFWILEQLYVGKAEQLQGVRECKTAYETSIRLLQKDKLSKEEIDKQLAKIKVMEEEKLKENIKILNDLMGEGISYVKRVEKPPTREFPSLTEQSFLNRLLINAKNSLVKYYQSENYSYVKSLIGNKRYPILEKFIYPRLLDDNIEYIDRVEFVKKYNSSSPDEIEVYNKQKHKKVNFVDLKDLFEVSNSYQKLPKTILIYGPSGIGKSTTCKAITNLWINQDSKLWNDKFDWVFHITLRNLITYFPIEQLDEFKKKSNFELLVDILYYEMFKKFETSYTRAEVKAVWEILTMNKNKILFVLDGASDIAPYPHLTEVINLLCTNDYCIITSRPYFLHNISSDISYENIGFTSQDVEKYFQLTFKHSSQAPDLKNILTFLQNNQDSGGVMYLPINLELICGLLKERKTSQGEKQLLNLTDLYDRLIHKLLRQYLINRVTNPIYLNDLSLIDDKKVESMCKLPLSFLNEAALENVLIDVESGVIKSSLIQSLLSREDLVKSDPYLLKDLLEAGFINSIYSDEVEANRDYYFIHSSFQDYFAARALATMFLSKDEALCKKATNFINENKYNNQRWRIWKFLSGILALSNNENALRKFWKIISISTDLIGYGHQYLVCMCLDNMKCPDYLLKDDDNWQSFYGFINTLLEQDNYMEVMRILMPIMNFSHVINKLDIIEWINKNLKSGSNEKSRFSMLLIGKLHTINYNEVIEAQLALLKDEKMENKDKKYQIIYLLGEIGPAAAIHEVISELLSFYFNDKDCHFIPHPVIHALLKMGSASITQEVKDEILTNLHGDIDRTKKALDLIRNLGPGSINSIEKNVELAIVNILKTPSHPCLLQTLFALRKVGEKLASSQIAKLLINMVTVNKQKENSNNDHRKGNYIADIDRGSVIDALGGMGLAAIDENVIEVLFNIINEESDTFTIKNYVLDSIVKLIKFLSSSKNKKLEEKLNSIISSFVNYLLDSKMRENAAGVLREVKCEVPIPKEIQEILLALLEELKYQEKYTGDSKAILLLSQVPEKLLIPKIPHVALSALTDTNERTLFCAIELLSKIKLAPSIQAEAIKLISKLLTKEKIKSNKELSRSCLDGLEKICSENPTRIVIEKIIEIINNQEFDWAVRNSAIQIIANMGYKATIAMPEVIGVLEEHFNSDNHFISGTAAYALGQMGALTANIDTLRLLVASLSKPIKDELSIQSAAEIGDLLAIGMALINDAGVGRGMSVTLLNKLQFNANDLSQLNEQELMLMIRSDIIFPSTKISELLKTYLKTRNELWLIFILVHLYGVHTFTTSFISDKEKIIIYSLSEIDIVRYSSEEERVDLIKKLLFLSQKLWGGVSPFFRKTLQKNYSDIYAAITINEIDIKKLMKPDGSAKSTSLGERLKDPSVIEDKKEEFDLLEENISADKPFLGALNEELEGFRARWFQEIEDKKLAYQLQQEEIAALKESLSFLNSLNNAPKPIDDKVFPAKERQLLEIDTPHDGSCLFYSIALSILLPLINQDTEFEKRFIQLFGEANKPGIGDLKFLLKQYDGSLDFVERKMPQLEVLVDTEFRQRLATFMKMNEQHFAEFFDETETLEQRLKTIVRPKAWGDHWEIKAASIFLKIKINIFEYQDKKLIKRETCGENSETEISLVFTVANDKKGSVKNHYHYLLERRLLIGFVPESSQLSIERGDSEMAGDKNIILPKEASSLKIDSKISDDEAEKNPLKIVLIGNEKSKKYEIKDFLIKNPSKQTYKATIGVDFVSTTMRLSNTACRLQLWDFAWQERFRGGMAKTYLNEAGCIIFFHNIEDQLAWKNLIDLKKFIDEHVPGTPIILVLTTSYSKLILEEGRRLAKEINALSYWDCSEITEEKAQKVFLAAAEIALALSEETGLCLLNAILNKDFNQAYELIEKGAKINHIIKTNPEWLNFNILTLLLTCGIRTNEAQKLFIKLLEKGADVNFAIQREDEWQGVTPLCMVVNNAEKKLGDDPTRIVEMLLKAGADPNYCIGHHEHGAIWGGHTPLSLVILNFHMHSKEVQKSLIKLLLEKGARINVKITTDNKWKNRTLLELTQDNCPSLYGELEEVTEVESAALNDVSNRKIPDNPELAIYSSVVNFSYSISVIFQEPKYITDQFLEEIIKIKGSSDFKVLKEILDRKDTKLRINNPYRGLGENRGLTALMIAIKNKNYLLVRLLITRGADIHIVKRNNSDLSIKEMKVTALSFAEELKNQFPNDVERRKIFIYLIHVKQQLESLHQEISTLLPKEELRSRASNELDNSRVQSNNLEPRDFPRWRKDNQIEKLTLNEGLSYFSDIAHFMEIQIFRKTERFIDSNYLLHAQDIARLIENIQFFDSKIYIQKICEEMSKILFDYQRTIYMQLVIKKSEIYFSKSWLNPDDYLIIEPVFKVLEKIAEEDPRRRNVTEDEIKIAKERISKLQFKYMNSVTSHGLEKNRLPEITRQLQIADKNALTSSLFDEAVNYIEQLQQSFEKNSEYEKYLYINIIMHCIYRRKGDLVEQKNQKENCYRIAYKIIDQALIYYKKLNLKSIFLEIWLNYHCGVISHKLNQMEQAISCYENALESYNEQNALGSRFSPFKNIIMRLPQSLLYMSRGYCYLDLGKLDESEKDFKSAKKLGYGISFLSFGSEEEISVTAEERKKGIERDLYRSQFDGLIYYGGCLINVQKFHDALGKNLDFSTIFTHYYFIKQNIDSFNKVKPLIPNNNIESVNKIIEEEYSTHWEKIKLSFNMAVNHFAGDGHPYLNQLNFEVVYTLDTFHYLLSLIKVKSQSICEVIVSSFSGIKLEDHPANIKQKIEHLVFLSKKLNKFILFIFHGAFIQDHFVCGLINKEDILFIDPFGIDETNNFFAQILGKAKVNKTTPFILIFETLQKENKLKGVWLSRNRLQNLKENQSNFDSSPAKKVSSGPIILELAMNLVQRNPEKFQEFWYQNTRKINFKETALRYYEVNLSLLSDELIALERLIPKYYDVGEFNLVEATDHLDEANNYSASICDLRVKHFKLLEALTKQYGEKFNLNMEKLNNYLSECEQPRRAHMLFNLLSQGTVSIEEFDAYLERKELISKIKTTTVISEKSYFEVILERGESKMASDEKVILPAVGPHPNQSTPQLVSSPPSLAISPVLHLSPLANNFLTFRRNVDLAFSSLQGKVVEIAANPKEYGLTEDGLSHRIIKMKSEISIDKISERQVTSYLSGLPASEIIKIRKEKDTHFGYSALHWCALYDCSEITETLRARGVKLEIIDKIGLNPMQLAALVGSRNFFMTEFKKNLSFSTLQVQLKESSHNPEFNFEVNELHLALLGKQIKLVNDIYEVYRQKAHHNINSEIKNIGNLLHLIVYISVSEEKSKTHFTVSAVNLMQLILRQYNKEEIKKLLEESKNNIEQCTPLVLAAKYGQIGVAQELIAYLKTHVEEVNGLGQMESAFYTAATHGQNDFVELFIHYYRFMPSSQHPAYNKTMTALAKKIEKRDEESEIYELIDTLIKDIGGRGYIDRYLPSDSQHQDYEGLVLAGGGGKGFIFPYALKALNYCCDMRSQRAAHSGQQASLRFDQIKRVAGTSAGAIFGLGIAIGYTLEEIENQLEYDFALFLESEHLDQVVKALNTDEPSIQKILDEVLQDLGFSLEIMKTIYEKTQSSHHPVLTGIWESAKHPMELYKEITKAMEKIKGLYKNFSGFSSGKVAYAFLKKLIEDKKLSADFTFGELADLVKLDSKKYKHLHVVVTNLTQGHFEVLSSENPIYRNYVVLDAVRASMSYPIVFKPHHLIIKEGTQFKTLQDEYIDGGVLRNFAIDEFDFKRYSNTDWPGDPDHPELNKRTIGIRFKEEEQTTIDPASQTDLLSKLKGFVHIYMQAESLIGAYMDREYHRSIEMDTGRIITFTFKKLDSEEKAFLERRAKIGVRRFFFGKGFNEAKQVQQYGSFFLDKSWESDEEKEVKSPQIGGAHALVKK